MPNVSSPVRFKFGSQEDYDNASKSEDSVYFTNDTLRLFLGDKEYTRPALSGTEVPSTTCPPYSIYIRDLTKTEEGQDPVVIGREFWYNKTGASDAWIKVDLVPSYTEEDEGKFLRVVNGVAGWSEIVAAEGESF